MRLANYIAIALCTLLIGCSASVSNPGGMASTYVNNASSIGGIGIDSADIIGATEAMTADMMQNPLLSGRNPAPRIIVDAEYFRNESSSRINKNSITDRLRIELNKAAAGHLIFLGRHYAQMIDKEREQKRSGALSQGTLGMAQSKAGADFRLGGRITSQDAINPKTGLMSRFHQIVFEMVDLETGIIIWNGIYDFKKAAQDDVLYR